jgi:hypothetical protein
MPVNKSSEPGQEDAPPVLGSWKRIYAVVLGELALLILLFGLFSKVFS